MGGVQVCQRRKNSGDPSSAEVAAEDVELWSVRDSIELCEEGEEHIFRTKARLLDATEVSTVAAAVQSLNEGHLALPEGFGVVHSATKSRYYLLWQKDRKSMALERLGVSETDLETLVHQRRQIKQPRRQPFLKPDPSEFQITLDRTGGLPLGIDVQKALTQRLIIEGVGESGLVASWNASNPDHKVKLGDYIVEVNGKRGDMEAIVNECRQLQPLVLTILPHRVADEETFNVRASSSTERRDASCNTSPYDPNEEPSRAEVCLPVTMDAEVENPHASTGTSSSSSGDRDQAVVRSQAARVTKEYDIELDRTDGSKLGIDVAPAHEAHPQAHLLIEGISEGLVQTWNDTHPDLRVEVGDSIVEVNGYRGDLRKMIGECKMDQLLHVRLQRVADAA